LVNHPTKNGTFPDKLLLSKVIIERLWTHSFCQRLYHSLTSLYKEHFSLRFVPFSRETKVLNNLVPNLQMLLLIVCEEKPDAFFMETKFSARFYLEA